MTKEGVMAGRITRLAIAASFVVLFATSARAADVRFSVHVGVPARVVVPGPVYVAQPPVYAAPYPYYGGSVWEPGYYVTVGYGRRWVPGRWVPRSYYRRRRFEERRYEERRWDRRRW
jgi:hypothetical protein